MTSVPVRLMTNLLFEACCGTVNTFDTTFNLVWKSNMNSATVYVFVQNEIVDEVSRIEITSLLLEVEKIGSVLGMVANARVYFP